MKNVVYLFLAIIIFLVVYYGSPIYTVDETEQVIITRLGKPVGETINTPGLKLKVPFFHKVNKFPKNLLEWDGDKGQVPTKDKTFIWVDVFGRWRISEPLTYLEKVREEAVAQHILDGILDAAVRNLITSNLLIETVRNTNREMVLDELRDTASESGSKLDSSKVDIALGRSGMSKAILDQAAPKLKEFGIELVDIQFKRINYADEVLHDVYDRMIAERKQIAEKYRSEGRADSKRIAGMKEKALKKITSTAYKRVQEIKGEADAEATKIYASAYNRDPEFYSFVKTLDLYKESFDSTSTVIMSTKSDMMKYFKTFKP